MKTGDHAPLTGVALRNTKPWKTSRAEVARAQAAWRECATLRKLAGFRNRALDGDQTIAPAIKAGKQVLVAVEYAVPLTDPMPEGFTGSQDVWNGTSGFPLWLLHAWVWAYNPDGVFNWTNESVELH